MTRSRRPSARTIAVVLALAETGRPPRHLYRLTGPGLALATELAEKASSAVTNPAGLRLRSEGA